MVPRETGSILTSMSPGGKPFHLLSSRKISSSWDGLPPSASEKIEKGPRLSAFDISFRRQKERVESEDVWRSKKQFAPRCEVGPEKAPNSGAPRTLTSASCRMVSTLKRRFDFKMDLIATSKPSLFLTALEHDPKVPAMQGHHQKLHSKETDGNREQQNAYAQVTA